jgi:hypothetical protein
MAIWYIFPRFGMLHKEKSGNPGHVGEPSKGQTWTDIQVEDKPLRGSADTLTNLHMDKTPQTFVRKVSSLT